MSESTQNKITNCHETKSQLSFIISSWQYNRRIRHFDMTRIFFTVMYVYTCMYVYVRFYCEMVFLIFFYVNFDLWLWCTHITNSSNSNTLRFIYQFYGPLFEMYDSTLYSIFFTYRRWKHITTTVQSFKWNENWSNQRLRLYRYGFFFFEINKHLGMMLCS